MPTGKKMKVDKQDLINKFESLSGYLRHENKHKLDKEFYDDLCDEVDEFCKDLSENEVEWSN
jgi:hypothetical protein